MDDSHRPKKQQKISASSSVSSTDPGTGVRVPPLLGGGAINARTFSPSTNTPITDKITGAKAATIKPNTPAKITPIDPNGHS